MSKRDDQAGAQGGGHARLAVFVSGSGRSLQSLIDRTAAGTLNATLALVVASRPCRAVEIAEASGIPAMVRTGELSPDQVGALANEHRLDLIVLAGYLRRLPVPPPLAGRVLNIHPALLPGDGTHGRFGGPGMYSRRVHEAVLAAGEPRSGCTVHACTDEYDAGPVILTRSCPVEPGGTPDTLAARVFALELEALPEAINTVIERILAEDDQQLQPDAAEPEP